MRRLIFALTHVALYMVTAATAQDHTEFTCLPGQSCWPSAAEWEAFNRTVRGSLRATIPWAQPCYADLHGSECAVIEASYDSGFARGSVYGAMQNLNWEACGAQSCQLDTLAPTTPVTGQCSLGRLSAYYVAARSTADIVKTLQFVRRHKLRLSIKSTGHDYVGRSVTANSLALWTRNLQGLEYHPSFSLHNCQAASLQNIGVIGAGAIASEATAYFQTYNMQYTVGAVGSVGPAGGYGQGGGHGPFGPSHGLMVDQAVEFDVVTADGKRRTINQCNDPDLFWALRGGGGSTFAVLVRYKLQLYPAVPINIFNFQASIPVNLQTSDVTKNTVLKDVVTALAHNQSTLSQNEVAGYNFFTPSSIITFQVLPSADTDALSRVTAQWSAFLTAYPGLNITLHEYKTFDQFTDYEAYVSNNRPLALNGAVAFSLAEAGRLIPRTQFESTENVDVLVSSFLAGLATASALGPAAGSGQIYATGPANQPDNSHTGVNPAWRGSLWEVIYVGFWIAGTPQATQNAITTTISQAMLPLKHITPGGGCYMNEADWTEPDWQQTFFGSNYGRLLEVKRQYDPSGLFNCWKCVGWTGADE